MTKDSLTEPLGDTLRPHLDEKAADDLTDRYLDEDASMRKDNLTERRAEAAHPEWHEVSSIAEMQSFYLACLPAIRNAARECGYAIGLHGSTVRDLDLIAVPWVEEYAVCDELARSIHKAACGFTSASYNWTVKPSGRIATSFPICWPNWYDMVSAGCIDLSIVAPSTIHAQQQALLEECAQVLWLVDHDPNKAKLSELAQKCCRDLYERLRGDHG